MYPKWKRLSTAVLSVLAAFTLLFSFAGSAQPALAAPPPPTVNGLFWGDGDHTVYQAIAWGTLSDSVLYKYVDPVVTEDRKLFVALVVDGNLNDNVFDRGYTSYMASAGWQSSPNVRPAFHLMNSEQAEFTVDICGTEDTWTQGYARQFDADGAIPISQSVIEQAGWVSNEEIATGSGAGTAPEGYESSSSIVWNLNNYASAPSFNMGVHCDTLGIDPCTVYDWKSPFHPLPLPGNTVTTTGGWPETITTTTPISYSTQYDWEWAMVYEWSVKLGECEDYSISTGSTHHSPSKTGISDDPTPVTLIALAASQSTALLPVAGLLVSVGTAIVAPRRRRRRR